MVVRAVIFESDEQRRQWGSELGFTSPKRLTPGSALGTVAPVSSREYKKLKLISGRYRGA